MDGCMDGWNDTKKQCNDESRRQSAVVRRSKMMRRETAADAVRERENRNKNEPVIFGAEAKSTHLVVIF
jgi:hypothetical protein